MWNKSYVLVLQPCPELVSGLDKGVHFGNRKDFVAKDRRKARAGLTISSQVQ